MFWFFIAVPVIFYLQFIRWTSWDIFNQSDRPAPSKPIRFISSSDISESDQAKWRIAIKEFITDPKRKKEERAEAISRIKEAAGVELNEKELKEFLNGGSLYEKFDNQTVSESRARARINKKAEKYLSDAFKNKKGSCPACGHGSLFKMTEGDRGSAFVEGGVILAFSKSMKCNSCGYLA